MAIPPKFFPKPLKDFPQLDFSSEISLENKRKNEEKIEKKPISSQIIDIVGHNRLSLSEHSLFSTIRIGCEKRSS